MENVIFENILSMTRGDTAKFKFQRKDSEGNVIETKADKCWFSVKTNDTQQNVVIQKTIEDMDFSEEDFFYRLTIEPNDTNNLQYGDYVYDVEVIQDNYKKTISKGQFIIEYEVTFINNEV